MSALKAYSCDGPHCGERAITDYPGWPIDWLALTFPGPDHVFASDSKVKANAGAKLHFHSFACLAEWVMTQVATELPVEDRPA